MGDGDGVYSFPFRQEDIANAQGLSVVHTNRVLKELRALDLIELRGRRLKLMNRDALSRRVRFDPAYLRSAPRRPAAPKAIIAASTAPRVRLLSRQPM